MPPLNLDVGRLKMGRRKVLIAVAVFAGVLGVAAVAYSPPSQHPLAFDAAVWAQGEQVPFSSDAPRLRMADGLVASGVLIGKTRMDVEAMLGPPTKTNKFKSYDLVYWLEGERGYISIDSEWLVVRFANVGTAREVRIVRD